MAEETKAHDVLRRMGGMSDRQAGRYLEQCTPEEAASLEQCENGKQFSAITNYIADRLNPPPQPEGEKLNEVEDAVDDEDEADEDDEPAEE